MRLIKTLNNMAHVKTIDGHDVKVPNQGQVNFNTVGAAGGIGWIAEKTGILNGLQFGGNGGWNRGGCPSPMDAPVTRYELGMEQQLAYKDAEIMELKANIFTDQKITESYKELRGMISNLQEVAAQQAIRNQGFSDAIREVQKDIDYKVALEAERRSCADCKIVDYSNSTFATKLIQPYGAGTEAGTPAPTYNPLACGSGCGC